MAQGIDNGKPRQMDYDRTALILVDAAFFGDSKAAKKWDIATRTLRGYWNRSRIDEALAAKFRIAYAERIASWADQLSPAIHAAVAFITDSLSQMDAANPDALQAATNALATLAEVQLTKEMVDARLAPTPGTTPTPYRPASAPGHHATA